MYFNIRRKPPETIKFVDTSVPLTLCNSGNLLSVYYLFKKTIKMFECDRICRYKIRFYFNLNRGTSENNDECVSVCKYVLKFLTSRKWFLNLAKYFTWPGLDLAINEKKK